MFICVLEDFNQRWNKSKKVERAGSWALVKYTALPPYFLLLWRLFRIQSRLVNCSRLKLLLVFIDANYTEDIKRSYLILP